MRKDTQYGTLELTDGPVIEWFIALEVTEGQKAQDQWVQRVTGEETAIVGGYMLEHDPLRLEIEYRYT